MDAGINPVELVQALEQHGFESLFLAEHSHIPAGLWAEVAKLA